MKVSIITVCFNSDTTIEDTIKSVVSQSYKDIEYIVIDGGSTDTTLRLIERYRSNISHMISEPDDGLYDAMNKGISLATGDVVGILNSDDIFFNSFVVENVVKQIKNVDAVYGDVQFYRNNFKTIVRHYSSKNFSPNKLPLGIMPAHPSLYVKRHKLLQSGLYDIRYRIASDFDMVLRLFTQVDFTYRYIPNVFVKMRIGGLSTSGLKSNFELNQEIICSCRNNGIKTNWLRVLSKYPGKLIGYAVKK